MFKIESQDNSAWKKLLKSQIQLPAHSRVNYQIRPCYSRFYPVWSLKPPRMERISCLWAASFKSPCSNVCTEILSSHAMLTFIIYQAVQHTVYPDLRPFSAAPETVSPQPALVKVIISSQTQDFILDLDEFHKVLTAHSSSLSGSIQMAGLTSRIQSTITGSSYSGFIMQVLSKMCENMSIREKKETQRKRKE